MANQKPLKIVFGDPFPGAVRVMMGSEEIPNIRSVAVKSTEPGELPVLEIKMLSPNLVVEDHTQGDVQEMTEVPLDLSTKNSSKKAETTLPKSTVKAAKK